MREGDVVIFFPADLSDKDIVHEDPEIQKKREAMFRGAMGMVPLSWEGEKAMQIYNELEEIYGEEPFLYACFFYDAIALLTEALDFIVFKGENMHDPYLLHDRVRTSRVHGCTGTVTIDSSSNDRWFLSLDVLSLTKRGDEWVSETIARYSPASAIVLEIFMEAVYPDGTETGTTTPPDPIRVTNTDCSHSDPELVLNQSSQTLSIVIILCTLTISLLLSLCCIRQEIRTPVTEITDKRAAFLNDMLVFGFMIIEKLQVISLVPRAYEFSYYFESLCRLVAADAVTHLFGVKLDFWLKFEVWVGVGIVLLLLRYCYIVSGPRLNQYWLINYINDSIFPTTVLIGNLLLIPLSKMMVSAMVCSYGYGDGLKEGIMDVDCNTECWSGLHLASVIIAICVLFLYVPAELVWKLPWQEGEPTLNILVNPKHWYLKYSLQLLAVGVAVLLDLYDKELQAWLVLAIGVLQCTLHITIPSYNYKRARLCNLSLEILSVMVLGGGIVAFWGIDQGVYTIVLLVSVLVVAIVCVLVILLKSKQLVSRVKDKDVTPFIRFQFSRRNPDEFGIYAKSLDYADAKKEVYRIED